MSQQCQIMSLQQPVIPVGVGSALLSSANLSRPLRYVYDRFSRLLILFTISRMFLLFGLLLVFPVCVHSRRKYPEKVSYQPLFA